MVFLAPRDPNRYAVEVTMEKMSVQEGTSKRQFKEESKIPNGDKIARLVQS